MQSQMQIEQIEPSYNGDVVPESIALTTALDQYWLERRALCEQTIERYSIAAGDTAAERDWQSFCSRRTSFLNRYLSKATDSIDAPLRDLWQSNFTMTREARKAFEREASVEAWIPFSHYPLKFACASPNSGTYIIREISDSAHPENFALGKAHVMVRWNETYLFIILPNQSFVTMGTYNFTKGDRTWSSEEVLPEVFAATLTQFTSKLFDLETLFTPLRALWNAKGQLSRATAQLHLIGRSGEAWQRVQLPDVQKLDILRRMELFENSDPAAPRGLLLHGPTGTGKSLIARMLAETLSCDFQSLSLADIKQEHLGASGKRVRQIWDHARAHRPSIIFIDECDGVFGRRIRQ